MTAQTAAPEGKVDPATLLSQAFIAQSERDRTALGEGQLPPEELDAMQQQSAALSALIAPSIGLPPKAAAETGGKGRMPELKKGRDQDERISPDSLFAWKAKMKQSVDLMTNINRMEVTARLLQKSVENVNATFDRIAPGLDAKIMKLARDKKMKPAEVLRQIYSGKDHGPEVESLRQEVQRVTNDPEMVQARNQHQRRAAEFTTASTGVREAMDTIGKDLSKEAAEAIETRLSASKKVVDEMPSFKTGAADMKSEDSMEKVKEAMKGCLEEVQKLVNALISKIGNMLGK